MQLVHELYGSDILKDFSLYFFQNKSLFSIIYTNVLVTKEFIYLHFSLPLLFPLSSTRGSLS